MFFYYQIHLKDIQWLWGDISPGISLYTVLRIWKNRAWQQEAWKANVTKPHSFSTGEEMLDFKAWTEGKPKLTKELEKMFLKWSLQHLCNEKCAYPLNILLKWNFDSLKNGPLKATTRVSPPPLLKYLLWFTETGQEKFKAWNKGSSSNCTFSNTSTKKEHQQNNCFDHNQYL